MNVFSFFLFFWSFFGLFFICIKKEQAEAVAREMFSPMLAQEVFASLLKKAALSSKLEHVM